MRKAQYEIVGASITPKAKLVYDLMKRDGGVTRLTAMHAGIPNLTARIAELRNAGMIIDCENKIDIRGDRYGKWFVPAVNGDQYVPREVR